MTDRPQSGQASKAGGIDPLIGRAINDRFRITGLIARGGMGKVYRAEQTPLGRLCAVKVLNPNYTGDHDPEFHKRFFLEASIASKLTHPNTVTIFDYGKTDDDIYYMAMELLEGTTLHRAIRESAPFPEDRVAHIGRQICRALREAHSHGVIHRDLKPANIFLVSHGDETDFVKVLDFGLVKNVSESRGEDLTQTGLFMGSPKYMAPEQIQGDRVDARTDIYSLGIIMYEMLTGRVPFDKPNSVNILMAHVNEPLPEMRAINPTIEVSEAMERTVQRCLAKDIGQRFGSMDELLQALKIAVPSITGTSEYRSADASASIPPVSGAMRVPGVSPGSDRKTPTPSPIARDGGGSPWPSQTPPGMPDLALSVSPPARGGGGAKVVAAGIVLVGVLAAVGVFAFVRTRGAMPLTAPVAATAVPLAQPVVTAPPKATAPPAPPAELLVKVRINTEPDGASVKEDGVEVCSSTPCDVLYKGADADPDHEHKLAVTHGGFKPELRTIKVGDSPVYVKLARAPAGHAPPPPPPPPSKGDDAPKGFKDIPY